MPTAHRSPPPHRPRRTTPAPVLALGALVCAVALAACGASGTPGGAGTSGAASDSAFPLTLTRSGGLVGFADRLTIAADGHVTGTTKGGAVDCTTERDVAEALAAALDRKDAATRAGSDRIEVTLAGGGRQVSLGEASGQDPVTVAAGALLGAVQHPPAPGSPCTTG